MRNIKITLNERDIERYTDVKIREALFNCSRHRSDNPDYVNGNAVRFLMDLDRYRTDVPQGVRGKLERLHSFEETRTLASDLVRRARLGHQVPPAILTQ